MSDDGEFAAMQAVYKALEPLEEEAQARVFAYVASRLGLNQPAPGRPVPTVAGTDISVDKAPQGKGAYEEFGELFDAFDPQTEPEKALAAAYWLMGHEGEESFDSQRINAMLKNLGHGVSNITRALGALIEQKPALVIQTRKSGSTKQARKTYKITRSGVAVITGRT